MMSISEAIQCWPPGPAGRCGGAERGGEAARGIRRAGGLFHGSERRRALVGGQCRLDAALLELLPRGGGSSR